VRQHQILEGIRWIPSDTSGGVLERGNSLQVISVRAGLPLLSCCTFGPYSSKYSNGDQLLTL
jgi:hypothetical protein